MGKDLAKTYDPIHLRIDFMPSGRKKDTFPLSSTMTKSLTAL